MAACGAAAGSVAGNGLVSTSSIAAVSARPDDPVAAVWAAAARAPIGDLDTHRLLELDGFDERVGALLGAIDDADVLLRHRLGDDGSLG